jgi:hypothetical protein
MSEDQADRATRWWKLLAGRSADRYDLAACGLLGTAALLMALTLDDYGITWDESWHQRYGDKIIEWYRSGFTNQEALYYRRIYLYGGGFNALGALLREASPLDEITTMRAFGSLVSWLGLLGTWRLARFLGGARAGFWAVALLALTPPYWGHGFNNPKDVPFATGYVWALYSIMLVRRKLPSVPRRDWAFVAVMLGLACCTRVGGLLTACYLLMVVGLTLAARGYRSRSWRTLDADVRQVTPGLVAALVGAWCLMLVAWPWALLSPLRRPVVALRRMTGFNLHVREMPFHGEWISDTDPPWDYLPTYFGIKLPEVVVICAVLSALALAVHLVQRRSVSRSTAERLALGFFILFPLAYGIIRASSLYDGLRHFLFVVPPLVIAAALGLDAAMRWLVPRFRRAPLVVSVLLGLYCADQVRIMVQLHPHEYLYFNRFVGGLPGAADRYSTDYYGNTYREAIAGLIAHLQQEDPDGYLQRRYVIGACAGSHMLRPLLPPNFRPRREWHDADFHLGYLRRHCAELYPQAPIIYEVKRFDTTLTVVRDRRGEPREP